VSREFRTFITRSVFCGLLAFALIMMGCGGGGGSSPVGPNLNQQPAWTTPLTQVRQALQTAPGTAWTADETGITLNFTQEEATALCGLIPDPLLSTFSTSLRGEIGFPTPSEEYGSRMSVLPRRFSWLDKDGRNWTSPVKTQGKYGTCVAFATLAAMEASYRISRNQATTSYDFSEWDLWVNGTKGKLPVPGGWYPSAAAEYLVETGVPDEEACPYSAIPNTPAIPENTHRYKIADWSMVSGREVIKQALLNGPVVSSMRVRADFFFYKSGVYSPQVGPEIGDHAILLIGYDDDQQCWIGQNSWSTFWGENGFFRIRFGQINDIGIQLSVTANGNMKIVDTSATSETEAQTEIPEYIGSASSVLNIGPYVREITATSAVVCWTTNEDTLSQVEYGAGASLSKTAAETTPSNRHSVRLSELSEATSYRFRISAQTDVGPVLLSTTQMFSTLSTTTTASPTPIIYDVAASGITKDTALITWKTDRAASSKVYYSNTSYASNSTDLRLLTAHSVTLKNLSGGTRYDFYVTSAIDSQVATSEPDIFTTVESHPPVITDISAHTITKNSATIVWKTDELSTSQVEYGKTSAYGLVSTIHTTPAYGHQVVLTGLAPLTDYYYRVRSNDANKNEASAAAPLPFKTLSDATVIVDTAPLTISEASATAITKSAANIVWLTDRLSTAQVEYGITPAFGMVTPVTSTLAYGHLVTLSGLTPSQTYYYRVRSKDAKNIEASSTADPFMTLSGTLPTLDAAAPVISDASATAITNSSAQVVWLTDKLTTAQVEYGTTPAFGLITPVSSTLSYGHLVNLAGLSASQTYYFRVRSKDAKNNEASATADPFTTLQNTVPPIDTTLPQITEASATAITKSSAQVVWLTDKLTTGQVEYGTTPAFGMTTPLIPTLSYGHLINLSGLSASQTYYFRVRSKDVKNAEASFTAEPFDTLQTTVPTLVITVPQITDASATAITRSSADIVWLTDTPSTAQVEYGTTPAYGLITTMNTTLSYGHLVTLTGLAPSQTYYYRVRSRDAKNNEASATASVPSFTTQPTSTPPVDPTSPVISSVSATLVTGTTATIVWLTNEPSTTQVEYGPTDAYGWIMPINTTLVPSHKMVLPGLSASQTYYFRVRSKDIDNNEAVASGSFSTLDKTIPILSNIFASSITGTSSIISFLTNEPCTAQVEYGMLDYTLVAYSSDTASTTFSIPLSGLSLRQNYKYRIRIYDISGNTTVSSIFSFTTLDTISPVISGITVTGITSSTAVISWNTDKSTSTVLGWGPTAGSNADGEITDPVLRLSHSAKISWLIDPTASVKHFSFITTDSIGNSATSGDQVFYLPLAINSVAVSGIVATSSTITCATNLPAGSIVEYGLTTTYGNQTAMTPVPSPYGTAHSVVLGGLVPLSTYHFRIRSTDQMGREMLSNDRTFSTPVSAAPPVISNLAALNVTPISVQITWLTDKTTSAVVTYGTSPGLYTLQAASTAPWSTSHSVALQGLLPGRTYYYRVTSTDAENLASVSGEKSFSTPGITTPLISAIEVTGLSSSSATIAWITDQPTSSQVEYGFTTGYTAASPFDSTATTTHSVAISQLSTYRLYHFRVRSRNTAGLEAVSVDGTFLTPDQSAPIIYDLFVQNITGTSATIIWKTDENSDTRLEYGVSLPLTGIAGINSLISKNHTVVVAGLLSSTTYTINAVSTDQFNNTASLTATFSTLDRTGPVISNVNVTPTANPAEAVITWDTNEAATSQVEYGLTTAYGSQMPQFPFPSTATTTHSVALTGLTNPASYHFRVRSADAAGNLNISRDFLFSTSDQTKPVISEITVATITNTSATIAWTTDEAADSMVYFGITTAYAEAGSPKSASALVKDHSITLNNLTEKTTYHFLVRTKDAYGNQTDSEDFTFTTADLTPPVISGIATSTVLENGATITWNTGEGATSLVEYGLTTAYGTTTTVTEALAASHSVTINGLTPFTTYHFRVRSTDAAGNESISSDYSFTTRETLLIQNVRLASYDQNTAIITWTTNTGAACYLRHGTVLPVDFLTTEDSAPWGTSHSVTIYLSGAPVVAGTTYSFQIKAFTGSDVNSYSEIRSFVIP